MINSSNLALVLPQLNLDSDVISDIQTAVAYGKQVTVSQSNINFNGWTGCGYIVFDPVTGGGAYLISGGLNGAFLFLLWASTFLLVVALSTLGVLPLIVAPILGALINLFGSQKIKIEFGILNSYDINSQNISLSVLDIISQLSLGAGLFALGLVSVPIWAFSVAAILLYSIMASFDFLIFNLAMIQITNHKSEIC